MQSTVLRLCCPWLAAVAVLLCSATARADEYAPVNDLLRRGQLAEAMTRADQYLATNPRDPQMRFLKGLIQQDAGNTAAAITTYTRLIEDYPELPEPYNNVAVLYAGQGQYDKARAALEMATRTSRSYAVAHENLGDVYARLASQSYALALQFDNRNTTVAPKMALIRQLFGPPTRVPQLATPVQAPAAAASRTR